MEFCKIQAMKIRHDSAFVRWFAYQADRRLSGTDKREWIGRPMLQILLITLNLPQVSIGLPSTASSPPVTRRARPGTGLTFPPVPPDRSRPPTPKYPCVGLRFSVAHCPATSEGPLSKITMHTDPTISALDWGLTVPRVPTSNLRINHRSLLPATRLVAKVLTDGTLCKVSLVSKVILSNNVILDEQIESTSKQECHTQSWVLRALVFSRHFFKNLC